MPNRIAPINPNASKAGQIQAMNAALRILDREAVVKQFKGGNGESFIIGKTGDNTLGLTATQGENVAMQVGKYNATRYGSLYYDENGTPVALMGQAPDDGRMGIWVAKPGQNVLTLLGG